MKIGEFLMAYAMKNGLGQVVEDNESLVSSFMEMPVSVEKQRRALSIVGAAAEVAVEPLDFFYTAARQAQLLKAHAPRTPRRLMMGHIKHNVFNLPELLHTTLDEQLFNIPPQVLVDQQG